MTTKGTNGEVLSKRTFNYWWLAHGWALGRTLLAWVKHPSRISIRVN